ncbi:hypothetical protein ACHWQZ_G002188 [Mnemiopsis leidyi]
MSISDSQQKREAVVEDFRTIRLSNGRNLTEDTPQTAVSPWNYPSTRSCGFSQDQLKNYDDSDAESHGSEEEVLENAGVWNVEEAHRILRDKMKKLQKLYALQMKHLHMEYKSQRRKYLLEKAQCLNRNKSGSHPMQNQQPTFQDFKVHSSKQLSRELLIKAKTRHCLRNYCKKRGIDAVLYKRQQARRQQQALSMYNKSELRGQELNKLNNLYSSSQYVQLHHEDEIVTRNKEILEHKLSLEKQYSELGLVIGRCRACDEIALPLAVYCRAHMGHDPQQLLFKCCTHEGCKRTTLSANNERCDYHPLILDMLPPKQSNKLVEVKVEPVTQDKGTSTVKQNGEDEHIKSEPKPSST